MEAGENPAQAYPYCNEDNETQAIVPLWEWEGVSADDSEPGYLLNA